MLYNYLKIAYRSLLNRKLYSLINIVGLALGLTAAIFIWQYISLERSYDNFHQKADRIYRVSVSFLTGGVQDDTSAMNAAPIGPALMDEYPEVVAFVRTTPEYGRTILKYEAQQFEETKVFFADSNFFDFFDYPVIEGNAKSALLAPYSIVLTKSLAERYFGPSASWSESPIGKTIKRNNSTDFKITAITEDSPENTHFKFNALISFSTFPITNGDPSNQWEWNDFYTYILLDDGADVDALDVKLKDFADRHLNSKGSQEYSVHYHTQPLKDIHLYSNITWEAEPNGDAKTVYFLWLVALAVILIAWANYINLTTARSADRATEVGVRKVIGASRRSLITQFLTEAFLVNIAAVVLGITLVLLFQPYMNILTGTALEPFQGSTFYWVLMLAVYLFGGTLVSGLYPAFVLSKHTPAKTINATNIGGHQGWFRKGLVTFQYASSMVLIISTIVIFRQLNYMEQADLGFSIDQKIVVHSPSIYGDSLEHSLYNSFKNTLLQNPQIQNVTASSAVPGKYYYDLDSYGGVRLQGADEKSGASFTAYRIDEDYYDTYGMEIIAGVPFSRETAADDYSFAVNEAALPLLGIASPEEAIGKKIRLQSDRETWPITNVIKNYHHRSLKHKFEPTILWNFPIQPLYYTIRFNSSSADEVGLLLADIEGKWNGVFTENPINYFFFDDQFNDQYQADAKLGQIVGTFSLLAVLVACLGLFGITAHMISIKTKEIGIRKILGASISSLVTRLSTDFLQLILFAVIIAVPLGLYVGQKWLEGFAYQSTLSWWIFALAGGLVVLVALVTVSIQSLKAALANPVDSLRNE